MLEEYGVKDTERLRAAWIPNYWVANGGQMGYYGEGHLMTQNRVYGDRDMPGIIDNKNWKVSFNPDGTALLVSTWAEYDDTAALQLVKYTDESGNDRMTIVGCYEYLWADSPILSNATAQFPAYLYAAEPVGITPPHECVWSPWVEDDVTDTHTRECTLDGCDKTQTEKHNWDNGTQTGAPSCTETGTVLYTCPTCNATKADSVPALDHDWGDWTYDSVDSHIRSCKRNCGVDEESEGHAWGNWVPVDDATHKMTCTVCEGKQTGTHDWDNGKVTKEPTEWEEGIKTYICTTCSHTKAESIDKLVHECVWTDWYPNGDENHMRDCMDDNCDQFETELHQWDEGKVTKEPSCKEAGILTFSCQVCWHTKTTNIPVTNHEFGDWIPNNDETTHSHFCDCGEFETADHTFDNGEVTQAPSHEAVGEIKYTCQDCGYSYAEEIPVLTEHKWGEWVVNKQDEKNTHIRFCICNESETAPHNFDDGKVTEDATHTSPGTVTYTCEDCGYSYDEEIPATPEHQWTDWSPNGDGTHTRACRCNATETQDCQWDDGIVTEAPTHVEPGMMTYTCNICADYYHEEIPVLTEHQWGEWVVNKQDEKNTHIRFCICNESQTAPHNFDGGKVTAEATHTAKGTLTYTCEDCGYSYDEEIPTTPEHQWTDWSPNGDGTHTRACRCNATETGNCVWDGGVVTQQPTHYGEGIRTYTCSTCSGTKTESIAKTSDHQWSDWAAMNDGRTHIRECKCGVTETLAHNWTAWAEQSTGQYKRECTDCGAAEWMTLDEEKPVNTTPSDNAADANLNNTDLELIDKLLTDEEQSQVADGAEVKVYLKVEDISNTVSAGDRAEAEAKAGNDEIGMYLDIDLFKQVGTAPETSVTETSGKVTITITIPEELVNTNDSVTRTYKIIRVHQDKNGDLVTDIIEGIFNPEDNSFTFQTDKFSTYALAYSDTTEGSSLQTGDLDGNSIVDEDDAIFLLQHVLMPDLFVVSQPVDFDGNGIVDEDDAIFLLQHVLMPDLFPLQ